MVYLPTFDYKYRIHVWYVYLPTFIINISIKCIGKYTPYMDPMGLIPRMMVCKSFLLSNRAIYLAYPF